ncbi:hypothetical protein, partial [Candidatus Chloroploca asiatica]|uniref:hypothetical protein n=1 Tax=Candidatus Chloroploca asiatica TaxID=1506545 RepID=UPI00155906A0
QTIFIGWMGIPIVSPAVGRTFSAVSFRRGSRHYNVLTSNGGDVATNDAGAETGNHHRWWNGAVQHLQTVNNNYAAYPSGDSHPTTAGHQKATAEFVPLLNIAYHRWQSDSPPTDSRVYLPIILKQAASQPPAGDSLVQLQDFTLVCGA